MIIRAKLRLVEIKHRLCILTEQDLISLSGVGNLYKAGNTNQSRVDVVSKVVETKS